MGMVYGMVWYVLRTYSVVLTVSDAVLISLNSSTPEN